MQKKSSALLQVIQYYSPGNTYDSLYLSNYATINVIDALKRVTGVGDATLFGPLNYSLRIWLDPERLTGLGLTPTDVTDAIRSQNIQAAVGRVGAAPLASHQQLQLSITTQGRLIEVEEFENIVVEPTRTARWCGSGMWRGSRSAPSGRTRSRYNGSASAAIGIYQAPGANAVQVTDGVRAVLAQLAQRYPQDLTHEVVYDTTVFVKATIEQSSTRSSRRSCWSRSWCSCSSASCARR